MLERQRFRSEGADTTRTEQFRDGDKQVDRQTSQLEGPIPHLIAVTLNDSDGQFNCLCHNGGGHIH